MGQGTHLGVERGTAVGARVTRTLLAAWGRGWLSWENEGRSEQRGDGTRCNTRCGVGAGEIGLPRAGTADSAASRRCARNPPSAAEAQQPNPQLPGTLTGGGLIRHAVCGVTPSQRQALLPAGARASSPRDVARGVKLPRQRARACLEPGTSIIQEKIGFPGARLLRKWETRETRGHIVFQGPKAPRERPWCGSRETGFPARCNISCHLCISCHMWR